MLKIFRERPGGAQLAETQCTKLRDRLKYGNRKGYKMARKKFKAEEILVILREAEILVKHLLFCSDFIQMALAHSE